LIVPNPESALNAEAGKLMQEQYDDYVKRAKLMTSIHAPKADGTSADTATAVASADGHPAGQAGEAAEVVAAAKQRAIAAVVADKKRTLKRL
jgi:ubiquitin-conjugating enzyme E2 S